MSAPTRPTAERPGARVSTRTLVVVGGLVCLLIAGVLSFFASGHPDGLEYVAQSAGFADSAEDSATAGSPFADYTTSGVSNGPLSGGLAGVVGVVVVALVMGGLVALLRRAGRRRG